MGPYCRYCDQRCFVHDPAGGSIILATCAKGMAHDLKSAGYNIGSAREYVETLHAFAGLVAAEPTNPRPTAADFASLVASLRLGAGADQSDAHPAEHLARLLAAAVLHSATADREREQHVEEIARLRAQLDTEQARAEYVKTRLRRRVRHAHRSRAALRATIRTGVAQ